jgi:predicted transcriptional regulator
MSRMTVPELSRILNGFVLTAEPPRDAAVTGAYACDMLSWVMAHAGPGDVWLTILNSINVVAVAELTGCTCVVLTEGVTMEPAVVERAGARNVTILSTSLTTFQAAGRLYPLLSGPV